MAYFAKVEGNKVVNVILADQSFIDSLAKSNPEQIWREGFLNLVGGVFYNDSNEPSEIQPTGNFRKNTPKIGMFYDQSKDVFYEEKPFESWSLNEDSFIWESPIPRPDDGKDYQWNEDSKSWVEVIAD